MAKIRVYKIAEELGIERNEFVEKARAIGIELKSAMTTVDEEEAALLREKLGEKVRRGPVTEARVARKGGGAVIRRRKRSAPVPEPEPPAPESELPAPLEPAPVPEEVGPVVPGVGEPEPPEPSTAPGEVEPVVPGVGEPEVPAPEPTV